jgi:gamma-glutamyltranspeptidase/glutathione hydrolase
MSRRSGRGPLAIATPHAAAAGVGRDLLLGGGNAFDAAVGAMLACCVAMPGSVGIGGYGGSLAAYLAGEGRVVAIDFDSRAPLAFRPEVFGGDRRNYVRGPLSIGVPAVVAGLGLALERFGTVSWAVASGPAITLAERGVEVSPGLKGELDRWAGWADPASLRALFPGGIVPEAGGRWLQPDMAGLLRLLAERGPGAFYRGDVPRRIVRQVRDRGGILAEEDFERYRPEVVEPIGVEYRGSRVLTPPPPSGGWTSLQILKTLEQFDLAALPPLGVAYFDLVARAARSSWRDRSEHAGDPDRTPLPLGPLLSEEAARDRATRIRRGGVSGAGGDPEPGSPHTVNILAADPAGNVVSMTATQGALYGSGVAIDGLGLLLGHGMSRFDLDGGSPNAPASGKRMAHNMAPAVILGPDGRPRAAVGMPGGTKIVTVTPQLVVSLLDLGLAPAEAVLAGRVHAEGAGPVAVSSAVPDPVVEGLRAIGHEVRRGQDEGGPPTEIGGPANALAIDPATGWVSAASQAGAWAAWSGDG